MSDTRVQNYFLTGKYPSIEDVQKIFETLKYFGGQADGVSLADLRKISQLPLTKLKVVLALLKKARFIEMRAQNRYRLKIAKTFRWRADGPVMQYFRQHAVADYYSGGFDGPGELLMLVHGHISGGQATLFNERLQRLAADFSQQHVADQKLPATEKCAYTVVLGMRSWLFAPFRGLLRSAA